MLKKEDEKWLGEAHPRLILTDTGVAGTIKFKAAYDANSNLFTILPMDVSEDIAGLVLTGEFNICITERSDKSISALPALLVEGVDPIPDRHFGHIDKSACLGSPLEEDEFLQPDFRFKAYLEQLVIPFLYGQLFYSRNQRWPWSEYSHGATGLLESYATFPDSAHIKNCLRQLAQDHRAWPAIRFLLQQKDYIKGHTPCFCTKKDQIRRCHPNALRGIQKLRNDVRLHKIVI